MQSNLIWMVSYCDDKNEWKKYCIVWSKNLWIKETLVFAVITIYGVFIINKYRITFFWFRAQNIEQQSYCFPLRWDWGEINIFQVECYFTSFANGKFQYQNRSTSWMPIGSNLHFNPFFVRSTRTFITLFRSDGGIFICKSFFP